MENNQLTEREVMSLLSAVRCHKKALESVCEDMIVAGRKTGKLALMREIETLSDAAEKLQKMIEEERE